MAERKVEVIVIDNGGCTIRAGLSTSASVIALPNCVAKVKGEHDSRTGATVLECTDLAALSVRRPIERGYLVNAPQQRDIWMHTLTQVMRKNPRGSSLLLTEPVLNFSSVQSRTDQIIFEELGCADYWSCPGGLLSLHEHAAIQPQLLANQAQVQYLAYLISARNCGLVVDAGFSFTHALPIFDGQLLESGIRRINLGGKALTNYFKELISYRSINMMDESFLIETIKDAVCFVSQDALADLKLAHSRDSPHRREFVLPDGLSSSRGFLRDPTMSGATPDKPGEQLLRINNERFMVPEALFSPADLGLNQAGLAETIVQSISATHEDLHELFYSNILLTGGTAKCPGFKNRLYTDLRKLVPIEYDINLHLPDDPALAAYKGAARVAASPLYSHLSWTKQAYEEGGSARLHGHEILLKRRAA